MKKKILLLLFSLAVISFVFNIYIEKRINDTFLKIKAEDIKHLKHYSNKNFYKYGIENIGESLQKKLIVLK